MKTKNNWWIDKNNNKWNCNIYTEEQAVKNSKSLINCVGCSNCSNCSDCVNCVGCYNCSNCSNCSGCSNCVDCVRCSDCSNCVRCSDCSNCVRCSDCSNCSNCVNCVGCSNCVNCVGCSNCNGCSDYKNNPNRYAIKRIGSKHKNTCIYWDQEQKSIQVVCGCFKGDLNSFKKAVINKYGVNCDYIEYIKITETIMKLERMYGFVE